MASEISHLKNAFCTSTTTTSKATRSPAFGAVMSKRNVSLKDEDQEPRQPSHYGRMVGLKIGSFLVTAHVGTHLDGDKIWKAQCERCDGTSYFTTCRLRHAVRKGLVPSCEDCRRAKNG